MINIVAIIIESIAMWLCLHVAFGESVKRNFSELMFFVVYIPICILCASGFYTEILYCGLWLYVFFWCKTKFSNKIFNSIIKIVIGVVILGLIELSLCTFYFYLTKKENFTMWEHNCIFCLMMCVVFFLYWIRFRKIQITKTMFDKNSLIVSIIILLFVLYVKYKFDNEKEIQFIYIAFFVVLTIVFMLMRKNQKTIFELEKRNINLELQNLYGKAYDELLKEVRRKQHDYKNQLLAISSIHTTANNLEELKVLQEEYLRIICEDNEFDSILTKCNNPILAGYIYNMCNKFKNSKYQIKVDVMVGESNIDIRTKNIIEILGVFLNNAIEYLEMNDELDKKVEIRVYQIEEKIEIEVLNTSKYIPYDTIRKMFEKDYSTKGKNRGLGLPSVKNIVSKYNGELYVDNLSVNNTNWVKFRVVI